MSGSKNNTARWFTCPAKHGGAIAALSSRRAQAGATENEVATKNRPPQFEKRLNVGGSRLLSLGCVMNFEKPLEY